MAALDLKRSSLSHRCGLTHNLAAAATLCFSCVQSISAQELPARNESVMKGSEKCEPAISPASPKLDILREPRLDSLSSLSAPRKITSHPHSY